MVMVAVVVAAVGKGFERVVTGKAGVGREGGKGSCELGRRRWEGVRVCDNKHAFCLFDYHPVYLLPS